MKKVKQIFALMILITIPLWMTAQPPHANGGSAPGANNTPVGGGTGAPIDGGISFLLMLGIGYGAKKTINLREKPAK